MSTSGPRWRAQRPTPRRTPIPDTACRPSEWRFIGRLLRRSFRRHQQTETEPSGPQGSTPHGPATITATANHPYWDTTTQKWALADQLHSGDNLQTSDGAPANILIIHDYTTTMVTYDLTVDDLHTYYVLAGTVSILVHNAGPAQKCDLTLGTGPFAKQGVAHQLLWSLRILHKQRTHIAYTAPEPKAG